MDIKPVGPERDLQIAELKETYKIGATTYGSMITSSGVIIDGDVIWNRQNGWPIMCSKWSTDRNDAWELWDELPVQRKINLLLYMLQILANLETIDFAGCVSKAWVVWKLTK